MRHLRLISFLMRNSRGTMVLMVCAGTLAGLFSAGVIALVSRALSHQQGSALLMLAFAGLVLGRIVSTTAAQLLLVRFSQGTILDLSLTLCEKVLSAPLRTLERRGAAQLHATLTDDVSSVTWAVQCLPQLAMNGAVLLGCGAYLLWLSWLMFAGAVVVTVLGAFVYHFLYERAFVEIRASRDARSRLFGHFRSLTSGIKELMMHRARRRALLDEEIAPAASEYRRSNLAATTHYALADAWMQILYYGLLGLMIFAFPLIAQPTPEALTGYAFAMLYMMAPLWAIFGALPAVARGHVALEKIEELGISLGSAAAESTSGIPAAPGPRASAPRIELRGALFHYDGVGDERSFTLGPLDFVLEPGEMVFVIGGNGSGKSTFAKVLTGLYTPHRGEVLIDGHAVQSQQAAYRENFSVVFSDCFLFDKLLGLDAPGIEATAASYLERVRLERKVTLRNRELSTTDLSQGQRKRLALVTAWLEDRPIYVFDEWAADQDPEFKDVFYTQLLPELRARGKSIVVITHDDRYFGLGDRRVKLEDGRVVHIDARATPLELRAVPGG
jgi:putative pyoverdin transport system ATP-binding/permease protein